MMNSPSARAAGASAPSTSRAATTPFHMSSSWTVCAHALNPGQEVGEDARRRAPDEVAADLEGVRLERHSAPHHPALAGSGHEIVERELEDLRDLGLADYPLQPGLDQAHERIDRVVGHERADGLQRAGDRDRLGRQPDLLARLAQ